MRVAFIVCPIFYGFATASWAQDPIVNPSPEPSDTVAPIQNGPPPIDQASRDWWREAQTDLFAGIALSAEQQAGVDTILDQAASDRARGRKLRQFVAHGPGVDDSDRRDRALAELSRLRGRLGPEGRIDAMRELLTEEQRALFDRSRRLRSDRLFEKERSRHRSAQQRSQQKVGSGISKGMKPQQTSGE
jgi:hypothetical protein